MFGRGRSTDWPKPWGKPSRLVAQIPCDRILRLLVRELRTIHQKENMIWQIAPSIKWTIFSGRNLVESKKSAQLQLDEEINSYNQTLLTALQEVDNALVTYNKSLLQISALNDAFQQSQLTLDLAIEQ
ncbi:MAG: TolC family protein [Butyricimonas faecalis]